MILVEGHWEVIETLNDVARVVREYYNDEIANVLDDLIEVQEDKIKELESIINQLDLSECDFCGMCV